ncbi:Odorant receptor 120, partial [Halyomorpha halys]
MVVTLWSFLKSYFLTQEKPEKAGYVFNTAHYFLYGLTVYKKKTRLAIPMEFILLLSSVVMFSSILQSLLDFWKTKWIELLCIYITLVTPILCSLTVILHRERIRAVSEQVDRWWNYPLLDKETKKMKTLAAVTMDRFNRYYFSAMYVAAAICGVLPFQQNNLSAEKMKPMDKLIFPMWTPFSIDGSWGFFAASLLQVLAIWFAYFSFGRLFSYFMSLSFTISNQMKLIGRACQTRLRRVEIMMKDLDITDNRSLDQLYIEMMMKDINCCIIHYQILYGHLKEIRRAFSLITNLTYHAGMWAMCLFGVSFVK